MRPGLGVDVAAPADLAWEELVDPTRWPHWGPTVRAARLDGPLGRLRAGATGAVQTPVGLWLPFEVDVWDDVGPRRTWSWRVAGVPATAHSVVTTSPSTCRVEMSAPWWGTPYLGVIGLALVRIRSRVEARTAG